MRFTMNVSKFLQFVCLLISVLITSSCTSLTNEDGSPKSFEDAYWESYCSYESTKKEQDCIDRFGNPDENIEENEND